MGGDGREYGSRLTIGSLSVGILQKSPGVEAKGAG